VAGTFGDGAIILHNRISGLTATSTGTLWFARGTIDIRATAKATMQADTSFAFTGTGRFTGGTGRFRAARGKFTVRGTIPPNDTVHTAFTTTGTLTY
jgi:hypothetical protein